MASTISNYEFIKTPINTTSNQITLGNYLDYATIMTTGTSTFWPTTTGVGSTISIGDFIPNVEYITTLRCTKCKRFMSPVKTHNCKK